jgi:hypothetical protein
LRTLDTVPKDIIKAYPKDARVHGLLAAELALDASAKFAKWNAVVPTRDDIWAALPMTWDARLHLFLPKPARDLLRKQITKFARDWALFQQLQQQDPEEKKEKQHSQVDGAAAADAPPPTSSALSRDTYLYHWLLVNTRTFYHESPRHKRLPREDRMVLQ